MKYLLLFLWCFGCLPLAAAPTADELLRAETVALLETAQMTEPSQAEFRSALLASSDWQHDFWDSGPIAEPAASLSVLFTLWQADPGLVERPIDRAMATAVALQGPVRNWDAGTLLKRYEFFRDNWERGFLNELYGQLPLFQRRFLANGVQHDRFNGLSSMEYCLEEVSLPAQDYTGACWYSPYLLNNAFGDSIHGPLYYAPFEGGWSSPAEMVRKVGGVCGSLSNLGASASIANGVPAVTMGEPGHCAYAVLDGEGGWTPAYSLSWQRGLHTTFFGGTWSWHVMTNEAFLKPEAGRQSGDLRRLARHYLAGGTFGKAKETIRTASARGPFDFQNWIDRAETLTTIKASESDWQILHNDVLQHLAPSYPEVAWDYLNKSVYPMVLPQGSDDRLARKRADIFLSFHQALNGWGESRWDLSNAITQQVKMVSEQAAQQDAFVLEIFRLHAAEGTLVPAVLEGHLPGLEKDQKRRSEFIVGLGKSLDGNKGDGEGYSETVIQLANSLLPPAAASGDKSTFQFIGKLASQYYPAIEDKTEPFPGVLLSSGGILTISRPGNRWDRPYQHWGVLEPRGGFFHTDAAPADATVQLGNLGRLSGVVITQPWGNHGRLNGAVLQASSDGQEWIDLHTFTEAKTVERIDLSDRTVDASHVRVHQPNGPHLHFNKFHVYGTKRN